MGGRAAGSGAGAALPGGRAFPGFAFLPFPPGAGGGAEASSPVPSPMVGSFTGMAAPSSSPFSSFLDSLLRPTPLLPRLAAVAFFASAALNSQSIIRWSSSKGLFRQNTGINTSFFNFSDLLMIKSEGTKKLSHNRQNSLLDMPMILNQLRSLPYFSLALSFSSTSVSTDALAWLNAAGILSLKGSAGSSKYDSIICICSCMVDNSDASATTQPSKSSKMIRALLLSFSTPSESFAIRRLTFPNNAPSSSIRSAAFSVHWLK
mmetsp:Transcript_24586/g.68446  ORF Transcript_24586/g.68446 Transcript_24586/m.68446 type:complete len:262 (+) Transcript_24586:364-1149(+)